MFFRSKQGKKRSSEVGKARNVLQIEAKQGMFFRERPGRVRNALYQGAESNDGRISHRSRNGRKGNNKSCEDLSLQLSFVPPARTETNRYTYGQMLVNGNHEYNKRVDSVSVDSIMSTSKHVKYRNVE